MGKSSTSWAPGQSGNPGGRPRYDPVLRDRCREFTTEAVETLVEIMRDVDASPSARSNAVQQILDRGWGKAVTAMEIDDRRTGGLVDILTQTDEGQGSGPPEADVVGDEDSERLPESRAFTGR